jgi:hypothetical protein
MGGLFGAAPTIEIRMTKRKVARTVPADLPAEADRVKMDYNGNRVETSDAMEVEVWRLPEALAWIRAARSECDAFVREARTAGERAFDLQGPRSGEIAEEGRMLLDMAAAGKIELYSPSGPIDKSRLGPEAMILPHGGSFAIWPHIHRVYYECIIDVWCERRNVQSLWRYADLSIASDERECQRWLEGEMRVASQTKTKKFCQEEARSRLPSLGVKGFGRAWDRAIEATGAQAWRRAGRRPKPKITT